MVTINPFLWYNSEAEEAAAFYAGLFPDSRMLSVTSLPSESPSGPAESVKVVEFLLCGRHFTAMAAPSRPEDFNHSISFSVMCKDQAEIDRYWDALVEGGQEQECGWLKDRYGLCWQITPEVLPKMMADPDRAKARRATDAMLKMVKIDIATLQAAYEGKTK